MSGFELVIEALRNAKKDTIRSGVKFGKKHPLMKYPAFLVLVLFIFFYNFVIHFSMLLHVKKPVARAIAISMSAILIFTSINLTALADSETETAQKVIGVQALSEEIANQILAVGSSESDIVFPSSLGVTVEKTEVVKTKKEIEKAVTSDDAAATASSVEDKPKEDADETIPLPADSKIEPQDNLNTQISSDTTDSSESKSEENTNTNEETDTGINSENNNNNEGTNTGDKEAESNNTDTDLETSSEENAGESSPSENAPTNSEDTMGSENNQQDSSDEQEGTDQASIIKDFFELFAPMTVYAAESISEETSDAEYEIVEEAVNTEEDITVDGVIWTINS